MSDRVRIYELARKLNRPAPVLIDACRELGYDVKSHSSTIDGHVVGLVIAHLGKKKQAPEKAEPKATFPVAKPPAASGTKAAAKAAAAPPPPVVKPRV
ncbi:MAG: translation initiation factor IF-2 N-terminal domain-containing protein, partial [Candidatus Saccharimonadales bacterium]